MRKAFRYMGYIFWDCFKAFPGLFAAIIVLNTVGVAATVLEPLLLAGILEQAAAGADGGSLGKAIVLYGGCLVCAPVVNSLFRSCFKMAGVKGEKYFGSKLVAFSGKIRLEALENPETLDKFHRANAGENSQLNFFQQAILATGNLVTCAGMLVIMGRYSPVLIFTGLLGLIPMVVLKMYFEKRLTSMRREMSPVERRCGYLRGLFSNREAVKEMRVMGFGDYLVGKWGEANEIKVQKFRETDLDIRRKQMLGILILNLFFALNIGVAFYLMVAGKVSVGAFAACLSAFIRYDGSNQVAIAMLFNMMHTYHVTEEYYDYFTIPTETDGQQAYEPFQEKITACNVRFRYDGSSEDALAGMSCEIRKGEHVVIVGENGSGKTTFSKLLTGAYLPGQGEILYDGQSTVDLNRKGLYEHISVVPQDFVRYNFSLRENVSLSDPGGPEDEAAMEECLVQVAGEEFLQKLGGIHVQLGRAFGGQELSGGEWQKVAIARGLWKKSDIIILDEPTSALDPLVEYHILTKFVEMIRNKTSVIISHRVGICRTADKIIVMKEGRVAEIGGHEELLQAGGEYARIWREQAKWYA